MHPEAGPGRAPQLSFLNGLEPNSFYSRFVTFEVPEAQEKLVLVYTPNFLTSTYETSSRSRAFGRADKPALIGP